MREADAARSAEGDAAPPDDHPGRWGALALLSVAVFLGMGAWFTASAVSPELQLRWGLGGSEVGWLTTTVQLGFVAGTALAALLNVADVVPARRYFAASAALAGLANAGLLVVPGYGWALVARFLTGFFLAGVYPPAMKMAATWFRSARGLAIGVVVGALIAGKATPWLLKAAGGGDLRSVVGAASAAGIASALLVALAYRDGPYPFARRPFSWGLVGEVVRHRPTALATAGYLGHMWELYAMWTWVPLYLLAVAELTGASAAAADIAAFGAITAGAAGSVWGGWAADRVGRPRVVTLAMAVSGACCVFAGAFADGPFLPLVLFTWVWGFFVVADSAQFSALVTEVAPSHAVGTALTLQTSAGFLLTMLTIQAVPVLVDVAGWAWAFPLLGLGPAAGILAIDRLRRHLPSAPGGRGGPDGRSPPGVGGTMA